MSIIEAAPSIAGELVACAGEFVGVLLAAASGVLQHLFADSEWVVAIRFDGFGLGYENTDIRTAVGELQAALPNGRVLSVKVQGGEAAYQSDQRIESGTSRKRRVPNGC